MNEQPQDRVSVISEISVYEGGSNGGHFAAALGWGTLVGTLSLIAAMFIIALSSPQGLWMIGSLAALTLIFSIFVGLFTLAGLISIGLPVTLILSISDEEHQLIYAAIGTFSGFAVMLILFGQGSAAGPEELLFAVPGGLAGGAAAWRWGGWREALAISRQNSPIPNPQPED